MKIKNLININLLAVLCVAFLSTNACAFGDYKSKDGHAISFGVSEKKQDLSDQKKLFIATFNSEYKDLEPPKIKPHFKTREDVTKWLDAVFDEEHTYFKDAKHPVRWITINKNNKIIGFALFEQWKAKKDVWHIRQMAVLPEEQSKGYGAALVWSILKLKPNLTSIIADTRKTNTNARAFYKKIGFKELKATHDPELNTELYLGLEWKKEH